MIRIGTVGTGAITRQFARAVSEVDGIHLAGVSSRDAARAAELATELGADEAFAGLDELLAAPSVDAVYIASPNALHVDQALAALRAGKHVLLEKPAALALAEWEALLEEAHRAGRVLIEAMRTPYDPGFAVLRGILPELGTLRRASLRFEGLSSRYARALAGERVNVFDPEMGGGALYDLGVYGIHAMVDLFGVPRRAWGSAAAISTGVEGAGIVVAEYDGLVVDVSYSKVTRSSLPSEIQGERASVTVDHIASPRRLVVAGEGGEREIAVPGEQHALTGEVERFVELVASGGSATADHARTAETLRIVDALRA